MTKPPRIDHYKHALLCQRFYGFLIIFSAICTLHNPTITILYATNKSSISSSLLLSFLSFLSFLPHFTSSSTQPWAFPTFRGVPWLILLNRWTYRNWSQIARRCYSPSETTPSAAASAPPTGIAHSSPSVPAGCSSSAVYSRQPIIKNPEQLLQEDSRRRRGVVLGKPHNAQNFPRKTVHREQIREEHRVDLDSKRR